jgi:hypothetical protein
VLEQDAGMVRRRDQQARRPDASDEEAAALHEVMVLETPPAFKAHPLSAIADVWENRSSLGFP